jgi:hypothetical protein
VASVAAILASLYREASKRSQEFPETRRGTFDWYANRGRLMDGKKNPGRSGSGFAIDPLPFERSA